MLSNGKMTGYNNNNECSENKIETIHRLNNILFIVIDKRRKLETKNENNTAHAKNIHEGPMFISVTSRTRSA